MSGAADIDMIDMSPGPGGRVSPSDSVYPCVSMFEANASSPPPTPHAGAEGAVLPGLVLVPHGAGEGGGDGGRDQTWHPPGQVLLLLHLLVTG